LEVPCADQRAAERHRKRTVRIEDTGLSAVCQERAFPRELPEVISPVKPAGVARLHEIVD